MSLIANLRPATRALPRAVITWDKAERIRRHSEIWANPDSIVHRLPLHYQRRYWENLLRDAAPVHYRRPTCRLHWDVKRAVFVERQDYPIVGLLPPGGDCGLWAGEGVVKGWRESRLFTTKKVLGRRWVPRWAHSRFHILEMTLDEMVVCRLWFPNVRDVVLYSEVLDKYMRISVTERAQRAIDANFGLDLYLLSTPDIDLRSRLAGKLKREILLTLARGDYYPDDEDRHAYISEKYAQFKMPIEEAEWIGLELNDACRKLQDLEDATRPEPRKLRLERELVRRIAKREDVATEEEPFIPKRRNVVQAEIKGVVGTLKDNPITRRITGTKRT